MIRYTARDKEQEMIRYTAHDKGQEMIRKNDFMLIALCFFFIYFFYLLFYYFPRISPKTFLSFFFCSKQTKLEK